jgi:N-acetyltransferase
MTEWLHDAELDGQLVKLIPLQKVHRDDLLQAAADGQLWNLWYTTVPSNTTIDEYIKFALDEKQNQRALPFIVINKATNSVIGTTRYCNAVPNHRRVEIGYTFYAKSHQQSGVNTECKFLLLSYAFEKLSCIAVEFRTNWHNQASRAAIARLGAKQDGVLRNHMVDADGTLRDTVVFSITREEWSAVKKLLKFKMESKY